MLEQLIVTYCAPTLAAVSTGNLFSCRCEEMDDLRGQLDRCSRCVNSKGVRLRLLRVADGTALIYVYRPKKLWKHLSDPAVKTFLTAEGYQMSGLCGMIDQMAARLQGDREFTHEIGVFLGYPLEDVKGFIQNKGNNYLCAGYWKVYHDELTARKVFEQFWLCTRLYGQWFLQGTSLRQLTVTA